MSLRAALFDLDGTLVDSRALYLEAYRCALEPFLGRRIADEEIFAARPTSETRFLAALLPDPDRLDDCLDGFFRHYEALHPTLFGGLFPGVADALAGLRRAGLRTAIVTGKSRRAWRITRAFADLDGFDALVFDDDVDEPKPSPRGIHAALAALGLPASDAIYVGDTRGDLEAAAAAGVHPVAVLWSRPPEHRPPLQEAAAAVRATVLASPTELLALLP